MEIGLFSLNLQLPITKSLFQRKDVCLHSTGSDSFGDLPSAGPRFTSSRLYVLQKKRETGKRFRIKLTIPNHAHQNSC